MGPDSRRRSKATWWENLLMGPYHSSLIHVTKSSGVWAVPLVGYKVSDINTLVDS